MLNDAPNTAGEIREVSVGKVHKISAEQMRDAVERLRNFAVAFPPQRKDYGYAAPAFGTFPPGSSPVVPMTADPTHSASQHTPQWNHSGYMEDSIVTWRLREVIRRSVEALRSWEFDAVAFRGMSGALIAPGVAIALDKTMILVRKTTEETHSFYRIEGDRGARTYIIVDDFESTGTTAKTIKEKIKDWAPRAVCLGMLEAHNITESKLLAARGRQYPLTSVR